jgi:recombination protein RecT
MSEQVSQAVARVGEAAGVIEASIGEFAKLLPPSVKPETFGRWSLSMIKRALGDAKQYEAWSRVLDPANPAGLASVMSGLMDAAALGLEPGREYHLVPFGGTVTGITDYKGEVRLITNAVAKSVVVAKLVRANDVFRAIGANCPPTHEARDDDWFADRGPVTGGYAFVDYAGETCSDVVIMPETAYSPDQDSFLHHREKAKTKTVWDEWPEAMRKKTLVHQLRKIVPWAIERQW